MKQRAETEYQYPLSAYASLLQTLQLKQYQEFCYNLYFLALSEPAPTSNKADRDGVTRFHTLSTDANGNQAESFKDVRERITAVLQHNPVAGQDDIWTSYSYNAVNELLQVKDDKGNLTQAIYDLAGRRTHINNPDTGWIESVYDDAGNVIAKITDNLRAQGKQISYVYDYNRLTNINYPNTTSNNVIYTYGNSPSELNAGRITKIVDASGERLFEYGKLSETTKETRTLFTYTATEPKTYVTQYRYDTWNRLRELTYPDGEVVTHSYDSGGKLSALQGVKGEYSYDYLKAMTYDKFGQRVFTKYANDTTATYSYEPERRRLSHLSTSNEERTFIDNTYQYDRMQNILGVSNAAAVPVDSPHFGGETAQSYSYDNLYQLTNAEGSWTTRQGHQHRYTLAMSYDTIGNIKAKNQNHERLPYEGDKWIEQKSTTYDWTYDHEGKQPHAPTKIGNRTFTYDLNGNQTGWENTQNATNRVIKWDEENRISTITDNGHTSYYVYDAGGERSLKRTAQGETFYVNAYFVIREGEVASKHFFAGSQRIATKMTKQESQTVQGKGNNDKPVNIIYEKEQYFYHPDHLGSSSFVTDEKGKVYEHLEYFPYGETFAHEHSNTQVTPYRFTGKELDEETGLYYYGARYYDPRTSVWQSPDPILDQYMNGKTNKGVFNPKNIGLFAYTHNNPVNYNDPDGMAVEYEPTALLGIDVHTAAAARTFRSMGYNAEVTLKNDMLGMHGRADMIIPNNQDRHVWELKPVSYRKIDSAKHASAIKQVQGYTNMGQEISDILGKNEKWSVGTQNGGKVPFKGTLSILFVSGVKKYKANLFIPKGEESKGLIYYTIESMGDAEFEEVAEKYGEAALEIGLNVAKKLIKSRLGLPEIPGKSKIPEPAR